MQLIPITISVLEYDIWAVLDDGNMDRLRAYDPAEVVLDKLPEPWRSMRLRSIQICYAKPSDMAEVARRLEAKDVRGALKFLSRGWTYRPEAGDHDEPYESGLE